MPDLRQPRVVYPMHEKREMSNEGVDGRPGNASRVPGRCQGRVPAAPSRRSSSAETIGGPEAETVSTMSKTQYAMHLLNQIGSIRAQSRLRERLFYVCRPNGNSAIRALRAGPGVYRDGFPLSPRARWQVVGSRKGRHARGAGCRKSRLFVGRCVDIHSLMDGLADRQYNTHADWRGCLDAYTSDRFSERECSLGHRGHGARAAKRHTKQMRMVAEPSVSDRSSC